MLPLKSKIAQKILGYMALHENHQLYINEMCRKFDVDRGNLVKKLNEFEKLGLLKSEWKGNQRYYGLNFDFPLIKEYKKIILKTVGLEKLLKELLGEQRGIKKAILFGSYAQNKMDLMSDLDLLVVGEHSTIELQRKIADLQKQVDREINLISIGLAEFEKKREHDPFLKSVFQKKRINLI